MAIFKAKMESQFAVIPNAALQDSNLSYEATGLLAMMLSLPDDWEIHKTWLQQQKVKCGRDKLTSMMNELIESGYVRKVVKQTEDGKLNGVDWLVYSETVQLENRKTVQPLDGKPVTTKETSLQKKQDTKGAAGSKKENLDYDKIKDIFNSTMTNSSSVIKLTDKRKKLVKKLFDDFELTYERFTNYLNFINHHPEMQWAYERRPKNDGSGQFWNAQTFEYFVGEKCFLNAKENLR